MPALQDEPLSSVRVSHVIRIVLDGVFNHASRGFWPFHHILENGGDSPYLDWFIIRGWPLRPYNSSRRYPPNYDCWWNLPALPKLNFDTPAVREYFLDVARYWIEFGIDGWRLDVPEEIEHEGFWQAFRRTVKGANPDAYIVGEIWHLAPEWLKGDRFDALMNYPMGEAAVSFFGGDALRTDYRQGEYNPEHIDGTELGRRLDTILTQYPWAATQVQLNCFDSHDTARLRWILGDDDAAMHMCVLFQMTMPGAPCVYYGDEIGLNGGHEPLSREAFPWDRESDWNRELLAAYREAIALRHAHSVLRTGDYLLLHGDGDLFAFARTLDDRVAIVAFNRGEKPTSLSIGVGDICRDGQRLTGIFGGAPDMTVKGHHVMLHAIPPRTGQVWVAEN